MICEECGAEYENVPLVERQPGVIYLDNIHCVTIKDNVFLALTNYGILEDDLIEEALNRP